MAYTMTNSKGQTYVLHSKKVTLKGGLHRQIYYFSKEENENKEFSIDAVPEGYEVVENPKTGLPFLKKA